jgi:hypothetical protein
LNIKEGKGAARHILNLVSALNKKEKQEVLKLLETEKYLPVSVFKSKLSGLEIIVKYLKEEEEKSFKEISKILNRKISTIYNTYRESKIKFNGNLDISSSPIRIPYKIFSNRKYSVLESIVAYLKDRRRLSLIQISLMLNRSYNTIKTVYKRYSIKNE